MKRFLIYVLIAMAVFSGCGKQSGIAGTWEQEMVISVLGTDTATQANSVLRFTFREDGTGIQAQSIVDGSHPDASREFKWILEDKTLTLDFGDGQTQIFSATMDGDVLGLENPRGSFELKKAE